MTEKTIFVLSANYEQINGQALATKSAVNALLSTFKVEEFIYIPGFKGILKYILMVFRVRKYLWNNSPDIAYVVPSRSIVGFLRDVPILSMLKYRKTKIIAHVHGNDFNLLDQFAVRFLARIVYKNIVLISPAKCMLIPEWLRSNTVEYLSNFVADDKLIDLDKFSNHRKMDNNSKINCLYISNLMYSKGVVNAILAIKHLNRYKDFTKLKFKLDIYGKISGDYIANENKISEIISFLIKDDSSFDFGLIRNGSEYLEAITKSTIFIFPTFYRTELAPLCLIEAMCNGKVIVTSDMPVVKDLCEGYPYISYTNNLPTVLAHDIYRSIYADQNEIKNVMVSFRKKFSHHQYEERLKKIIKMHISIN